MDAMGGISRENMEREDPGSSDQALKSTLDVSLTQQKSPGDGPHLRKDLRTWELEQREPRQGHLFCEIPWTGRQKSLRKRLHSALYMAELSNRALHPVIVRLDDL